VRLPHCPTSLLLLLAVILAACSGGEEQEVNSSAQTSGGTTSEAQMDTAADATRGPPPVKLVPTDVGLARGCRSAARILGFAVPCPTKLPPTSAAIRCETPPDFSGAEAEPKEGCALGEGFILEPKNPTVAHLLIEGSRDGFQSDCGERDPHRRVTVRGHEALLIDCPETAGLHAGHVLLRWVEEGIFVTVSAHGHTGHQAPVRPRLRAAGVPGLSPVGLPERRVSERDPRRPPRHLRLPSPRRSAPFHVAPTLAARQARRPGIGAIAKQEGADRAHSRQRGEHLPAPHRPPLDRERPRLRGWLSRSRPGSAKARSSGRAKHPTSCHPGALSRRADSKPSIRIELCGDCGSCARVRDDHRNFRETTSPQAGMDSRYIRKR
jgi:hypothetical protein